MEDNPIPPVSRPRKRIYRAAGGGLLPLPSVTLRVTAPPPHFVGEGALWGAATRQAGGAIIDMR